MTEIDPIRPKLSSVHLIKEILDTTEETVIEVDTSPRGVDEMTKISSNKIETPKVIDNESVPGFAPSTSGVTLDSHKSLKDTNVFDIKDTEKFQ